MKYEEIIDRETLKKLEELMKKLDPGEKAFKNTKELILQLKDNNKEDSDKKLTE